MFVEIFYFIVFLSSLIMLISFLVRNRKVDTLLIFFGITITSNCLGRYMTAITDNLDMAIWGQKFMYVGACFAPMFTVFLLARLCEHKIPIVLKVVLIGLSLVILGGVMTIGRTGLYYKRVTLGHANGYSYLIKEYGPLHRIYPAMMVLYAVIMVSYLAYAIKKRSQLSFRVVVTLCVSCFVIIVLYIIERVTHSSVSFLSVGYLIGIMLLINYFDRLNIYDMSTNIISTLERMKDYGYIVFDNKYRFVSANGYLRNIFPEIEDLSVDEAVEKTDTFFYHEVVEYLYNFDSGEKSKKTIIVGDKYFDMQVRIISHGRKACVGYLIEFIDRTLEKEYSVSLEREVAAQTADIMHIKDMMVLGMADMVESRDNNTGGHIKRTSAVVKVFSEKLEDYEEQVGLDHDFLNKVAKAAPMHDLGKIAIDDDILRKPGKFTPEEFEVMKTHAAEGARIVVNILKGVEDDNFVQIAKNVANYHHEKWNGKGYPTGIAGKTIPIEARIMALADVFDALVSKRCYKEAFTYDEAFKIIEESLGEHFDPDLGKIFITCRPELEAIYDSYN